MAEQKHTTDSEPEPRDGGTFDMLNKEQDKLIADLRVSEGKYEEKKQVEDEFESSPGVVSHGGEVKHPEANKTIMEKIKGKLPFPAASDASSEEDKEKDEGGADSKEEKGIVENIKDKLNKVENLKEKLNKD